jgi:transcriptional regulator with XRE-family HTH domain
MPIMKLSREAVGLATRFARESAGLTLVEFADVLGITKSSLSRAEHGERDLTYPESLEISDALKLEYNDFRTLAWNFERERLEDLNEFAKAANEVQRLAVRAAIGARFQAEQEGS